jgi:hypothetical protein
MLAMMAAVTGLVAVVLPTPARAGELGRLVPAATTTPLLGGRLTVRLPSAARVEARQQSIMAAPESSEEETRVVIDAGPERMVMMTYELFALAGADYSVGVRQSVMGMLGPGASAASIAALPAPAGAGLEVTRVVPGQLDLTRKAIPSQVAFLRHADQTVQMMVFYVNPAAGADLAGCRRLADRVLATVAAGSRTLPVAAGPRRLNGDGTVLELQSAAGYALTRQGGHDFTVFRLRKLAPLSSRKSPGTLGVYLGGHPSFQHRQTDATVKVDREPGTLLGGPVEWQRWTVDGRTTVEAIVRLGDRQAVHVFYGSTDPAVLAELKSMTTSLKRR